MQQMSSARKDKKGMNIPYQNEKPVSKNVCWTHTQVHVYMFFKVDLEILHFVPNNHKTAAHIQPSSSPEPFSNFNQTWHKASLGQGYIIRLFKGKTPPLFKGR